MKSKLFTQCEQRIHPVLNIYYYSLIGWYWTPGDTQSDPQSCRVRSLGAKGGSQKQTTHQETKTKLSSATPNRDKTIHCQGKRRKRHPTSNVAAESAPHPRHAAKACDNNTQTIPNNMVLWQRLATCSFAPDWAGNLQSATVFRGILHLQKRCCLLKLRQFWQKGSLQQSHFRGRRHIGFLDSKKWSSPVALKACFKQNPTLIHLRHAKSFVFRAARKVPHCQKWDCHALPLFALERAIPRLFSMSNLIAGETKNGHAKSTRLSVWQPCFWGCDMTLEGPSCFKSSPETMTPRKAGRMTQTFMCWTGEDRLRESKFYIPFQPQKRAWKQIEQFNDIILRILRFLAESSGVTKLELFQRFPHCKSGFRRCTDSARLRQDSATKNMKTGTKLW